MDLWVISTQEAFTHYTLQRLHEEAPALDFRLRVFRPGELDFAIATGGGSLSLRGERLEPPDVLLVRTGASTITFHTLALMRFLELNGTKVLNPAETYARAGDKLVTATHLAARGIPVPTVRLVEAGYDLAELEASFGFPVVVKEVGGARGSSVAFCSSSENLDEVLQLLFSVRRPTAHFIVQECLQGSVGRDVRCYVVGDQVLGAIARTAKVGRKANVSLGGEATKVELTGESLELVHRVREAVGLQIGGVDLLYAEDGFKVCEVNLSAQFVGFERATGVNVARTILAHCRDRVRGG